MKLLHCVLDSFILEIAGVDSMQYAFVPGRRTTDDICIISQLQDKYIAANKPLYLSFVDPEKVEESSFVGLKRAFGLRSGLYVSSMTCTCNMILEAACVSTVSTARSCGFEAVCIRELLNPLFFILVLEALSCQFRTGMPWVLL